MNTTEAKAILNKYNSWRRGGDVDMPDTKNIGIAIDVLLKRPEYGDIATELREAAIFNNEFISDQASSIAWSFVGVLENRENLQYANPLLNQHWATFLLFVAEAITW